MGGGTKQGHQRRDDDAGGRGGRGGRVGKQREVEPSISLPFVLWRKDGFRAGSERYDMAAFVKAAAACDTDVNELILQTGNTPVVMDKLRQILRFGFKVSTHTFQDIALPLMALVASDKFVLSPHTTDVKNILRAIHSEPLFFMRVRNCIEGETAALMAAGLFVRAVTSFAAVLNLIVQKIPSAALDDDMFNQAKTLLEWLVLHHNSDGVRLALASLRDTVELCMELVPSRRPVERDAARPNYLIGLGRNLLGQQHKSDDPAGAPAFDLGPRHDNDFADFRQVQVIPTDLEMRCLEPSYLPHCLAPNAGMEAHLEVHFRLLREDVLAQIKRGVQWLLDPQTLHRCVATGKWLPPREENVPRLNVATDARLDKVKGSIRKGIMFVIKAKQPLGRQGVRPKDLKAFWEREQRYKVGSLVCIACNVHLDHGPAHEGHADGGFPRYAGLAAESLVFATVCESNLVDLTSSEDDFSISVRICDTSKTADHIAALSNSRAQNLLVEVRGLFFPSYEPVLRALQAHNTRTLRKELQEGLFGSGTAEPAWKAKPAYVSRLDAYNLQFLVKAAFRQRVDLSRVPIVDFEQLAGVLRPLETEGCLTLDGSQVDAFAAALTQQVCLIQGPPGTGKSYVGTKIVHAIVQQRGLQVGPLLCVCYTNHALDQFLEDLVKDGLRVTSIVRIGAYSKSEMLQKRSLQLLEQVNLSSRQEKIRYGQLHRQCRDIETSFLDQLGTTPGGPTVSLMQWVKTYVSDEFASIVGSVDGDGFAAQGQSNKDHKARWKAWKKGEAKPNAGGMWAMSAQQRRDQIATWRAALEAFDKRNMSTQLDEYERCVAEADQVSNAKSLRLLKTANVVGITTTGAAKYHALLRALAPTVVVCEEAGEVLAAHLLSCLTSATQHVIQIGDHQQLRPILNEHILTHEAKRGYDLDVSLFERLVHERKDGASSDAAVPGSLVTLHVQRRMRPEICDLIRWTLYPRLCDGPNVVAYPATTRGFTHNLWFIDHDHGENTNDLSCKNSFEAELVVELVAHAVRQGYGLEDMTILTPYLGQLVLIRSYLSGKNFRVALEDKDVEAMRAADMDDDADDERLVGRPASKVAVQSLREFVRLSTVDNFQGNESPLVFISTVRNNDSGRTGFLKTFNRVNVMLSRARHAMYVLGSVSTIRRCAKAKMFNGVLDILQDKERIGRTIGLRCQNHGTITQVASASDIRQLSPDGGCLRPCDCRLNCGHTCVKLCHADDPRHMAVQCMEPCVKRVTVCGHLCIARCYESCRCNERIAHVTLPCGHERHNVLCAEVHGTAPLRCTTTMTVSMPFCNHSNTMSCAVARHLQRAMDDNDKNELWKMSKKCRTRCGVVRDGCGHACEEACHVCLHSRVPDGSTASLADMHAAGASTAHVDKCRRRCNRQLLCGHNCMEPCHPTGACPPCEARCRTECRHSACPRQCKEPCASCAEPCTWTCSHSNGTCELPCGSPCTRLPCDKRCTKELACGHQCPGLCGEPCLSPSYCRQCPPALDSEHSQVVDLIMGTMLADHDPDESPLVRLRCGHCFTIETMDGCMDLAAFYTRNAVGEWVSPTPLKAPSQGGAQYACPTCRAPVGGVHRYGRLINFSNVMLSELKYFHVVTDEIARAQAMRASSSADDLSNKVVQLRRFVAAETPTQEMWTKESSRLARLGCAGDSLNLNAYRHVMTSQTRIMLGLELLELLVLRLHVLKKTLLTSETFAAQLRADYDDGCKLEESLRQTCLQASSHRSANDVLLVGMKLRLAFYKQAVSNGMKVSKDALVQELRQSLRALQTSAHPVAAATLELAQDLVTVAENVGTLSKEEKDAIFKVFATGQDAYAHGFGGHWYQCPSGHPYVITECGGAMEEASCPECGAVIGGTSHRLHATNTSAESFFA
ncbi:hypothetical protein, variant [Aphanomyces invadans]|uniref:RZ-type domain-containing protein n=1 Tax=Aphanomyces invadans TaxID=157072 RepID=A0A024TJL0_9STRA|nr:hypothetical protein, variant [Aphanomyces invadans]XP_008877088.1 hypothetical protein H310_11973 [Aphanomyces invadans]ETV94325.1 hypothetical protein H310_11973 [Aphanomyces invadans]ETV94326.1 hypothetical protein, variant [Aphanomyces invadans]|eukprot:XP_008877087.1 hypothetical protein, variant [Aphanomyces invadans]